VEKQIRSALNKIDAIGHERADLMIFDSVVFVRIREIVLFVFS